MSEPETLLDLLVQWEEHRRDGTPVTVEDLCPGDPALQARLRERIQRRERMGALVDLPSAGATLPSAAFVPASIPSIAGFEILDVLGQGGMGIVYKARETALNRLVALKVILAGANAGPQERSRFRAEAQAVAALKHPNIVEIYAVGEANGCLYLILELVEGGSLADALNRGPQPHRVAAQLVLALAQAVQHAHEQGIIHRDLKPGNVLLQPKVEGQALKAQGPTSTGENRDGNSPAQAFGLATLSFELCSPKIADFGLAKRLDFDAGHTQTGAILGSPSYMAPEQASGQNRDVGPASDIYALGAILYEILTGKPPFQGATLVETLEHVRFRDPAPPSVLYPKIPRDIETICLKCLEKSPADRYLSAAELARDLRAFLADEPISARSLSWADHLTRTIAYSDLDKNFSVLNKFALMMAPIPFVAHLAVFLATWGTPHFAPALIATSLVVMVSSISFILLGTRAAMHVLPRHQRRHLVSGWTSHMVGVLLMPLVIHQLAPPATPDGWLVLYPLWIILAATTFFTLGSHHGIMYLIGSACFGLALFTLWQPWLAPLGVGLFMSGNMTLQGLMLRKLGNR